VVKALSSAYFELSDRAFMFTRSLDDALGFDAAHWSAQPVIVQSAIEHGADVRVIAFGGFHAAARANRRAIDFRTDPACRWQHCSIPESVIRGCDRYLKQLGLRFGAFDFIDDGDAWWFLECNQAGEWGWLDRQAGLGVSEPLADYLTQLAVTHDKR
jgi:glutathione synthase/RimK-type ligase-like ATP-grasp enzyme